MIAVIEAIKQADKAWACSMAHGKGIAECSIDCGYQGCLKEKHLKPIMVAVKINEMEAK